MSREIELLTILCDTIFIFWVTFIIYAIIKIYQESRKKSKQIG